MFLFLEGVFMIVEIFSSFSKKIFKLYIIFTVSRNFDLIYEINICRCEGTKVYQSYQTPLASYKSSFFVTD